MWASLPDDLIAHILRLRVEGDATARACSWAGSRCCAACACSATSTATCAPSWSARACDEKKGAVCSMTKLDGRLALIGALAVVATWPTWIPYERSVLMWLKFFVWRHFALLSALASAWILVRVYHEWNALHRQRALLATAALLVLLSGYLQFFLVYVQYVGDESVLRQCIAYCPSPFEDCLRVRDPARELVTSDVAQGFRTSLATRRRGSPTPSCHARRVATSCCTSRAHHTRCACR